MMGFYRRWRDRRDAKDHHNRRHIHYRPGEGHWIEREPGCPWCEENRQWWVDLRAGQAEETRKHRAKLAAKEAAYKRYTS
jgi:hypothetical protein